MANRRLSDEERKRLEPLLWEARQRLLSLAAGDSELHWALRRRLWNQLQYDERLKPPYRAALKRRKRAEQGGLCNLCKSPLPERGAILDRHRAMEGYTAENTQLICQPCDTLKQQRLNYT
jgi:hypothetical protein